MDDLNPGDCTLCATANVAERCWDGVCRTCHKTIGFEECIRDATQRARRVSEAVDRDMAGS